MPYVYRYNWNTGKYNHQVRRDRIAVEHLAEEGRLGAGPRNLEREGRRSERDIHTDLTRAVGDRKVADSD